MKTKKEILEYYNITFNHMLTINGMGCPLRTKSAERDKYVTMDTFVRCNPMTEKENFCPFSRNISGNDYDCEKNIINTLLLKEKIETWKKL